VNEQEKQTVEDIVSEIEETVEKAAVRTEKKDRKKSDSPSAFQRVSTFFKEVVGEARKVIWPDRKELQKKTITVILTSLLFAAIIFGYDSVYNAILYFFVGILGG